MAYLSMPDPDTYKQTIRAGAAIWYSVDATYNGAPVAGATDLRPTGGSVVDKSDTSSIIRRTLSLELAPDPGLFDRLSPIGTTLTVKAHVRMTNRAVVDIPMGVFDVDTQTFNDGGGQLSLSAPDKGVRIKRARFVGPSSSYGGFTVIGQLRQMIRDATTPTEQVNVLTARDAQMASQVWEKDRDKAILDVAKSFGLWVYFDRDGIATIADVPTIGVAADWLVDASPSGVLTELDRSRSRTDTYNVVVVSSSNSDGEKFPVQYIWDDDPGSPTYAGPSVPFSSGTPFGVVPYFFDTPLPNDVGEARAAGRSILSRVMGLASSVSLGQVPNPAVDAFDVLDVLPPRERRDIPRVVERHVADTVTHPLSVGTAQQIAGRSTRFEQIEGGS